MAAARNCVHVPALHDSSVVLVQQSETNLASPRGGASAPTPAGRSFVIGPHSARENRALPLGVCR